MRELTIRDLLLECAQRNPEVDALYGHKRAEFVRTHTLAAIVELVELLNTMHWKSWGAPATRGDYKESKFERATESVDVLLFVGNIINALGVDADTINAAYEAKSAIVAARLAPGSGYEG